MTDPEMRGAQAGRPDHQFTALRVLTYNIRAGRRLGGQLDLARIARVIRASGAHVIGLQEVDRHYGARSDFADQAGWLADQLRMHHAFGASLDLDPPAPGRPRRQFGNLILSVGPIVDWAILPLPHSDGSEQRGLLRARIQAAPSPALSPTSSPALSPASSPATCQVFVTHLQPGNPAGRLRQAHAIRDVLAEARATEPTTPVLLLGDLNAFPGTPEVRLLTEQLTDAWATAGRGRGYTFPNPVPYRRLDYIGVAGARVLHAAVVPARLASDHRPVLADLALGWS